MVSMEINPQEINERGDTPGESENRALSDATFQPEAYMEQVEDFWQAEAIQGSLESVMAAVTSPEARGTGGETSLQGIDGVAANPVPLPRPEMEADEIYEVGAKGQVEMDPDPIVRQGEEGGYKFYVKETSDLEEIPLPGTGGETGAKWEVEIVPKDIQQPGDDGVNLDGKGAIGVAETPLPGTGGVIGAKGEGEDLPGPFPGAGEEIGVKFANPESSSVMETPLPDSGEGTLAGIALGAINRIITNTEGSLLGENSQIRSFLVQFLSDDKQQTTSMRSTTKDAYDKMIKNLTEDLG